jgi:hypothetical protein
LTVFALALGLEMIDTLSRPQAGDDVIFLRDSFPGDHE